MNYTIITDNYLEHHGILGQKWGIRRYQNFDGSYTKAGLKRYNESKTNYEQKKQDYKTAKINKESKYNIKMAKGKMKQAKRQMDKDYKHLSNDMKGDKGKVRYMNGERIRYNNSIDNALKTAGALSIAAAGYAYDNKMINTRVATAVAGIGTMSIAAGFARSAVKSNANNQLRAYYGHTSKY